jgi:uncharacterized CHY-type Zn-finger protein
MSNIDSTKELSLDNMGAKEGVSGPIVICAKCKRKLIIGDYGQKDKFGNRFCNLKCLRAFHGIPEIHD